MVLNPLNMYPAYNGLSGRLNTAPVNDQHLNFPWNQTNTVMFGQGLATIDPQLQAELNLIREIYKPFIELQQRLLNNPDKLEKKSNGVKKGLLYALSPVPTFRRMMSVPDSLDDGNGGRILGTASLTLLNMPQDLREINLAGREIKDIYSGLTDGSAKSLKEVFSKNAINRQHKFHFLKNTFIDKFIQEHGLLDNLPGVKNWLDKADTTLYDTKFGKFITDKFSIEQIDKGKTIKGKGVTGFKFKGDYFKQVTGKSLMRISKLGLATSAIFEIPALIKSLKVEGSLFDKAKSFGKQLLKSSSFIGFTVGAIAILGALTPAGLTASLICMALGSAIGIKASNITNKQIDKLIA